MKKGVFFLILFSAAISSFRWGFFAHQRINQLAVFTLPPPLNQFYKAHIKYLSDNAVNPDMRRYDIKEEAPRHYIDLDIYPDSTIEFLQQNWYRVTEKIPADSLNEYGIVPWHIVTMYHRLKDAFLQKDPARILKLSAEIGHYIGDANVPLHTTENYNGQLTNQRGIHGFWESRLPELFFEDYTFFVGKAEYIESPLREAWKAVISGHQALDSVLRFEKELSNKFPADKKYTYEERGNSFVRTYSREYATSYHEMLSGMVERRMQASVKMVGDFWYTCWVHAGQPDMSEFIEFDFSEWEKENQKKEREGWLNKLFNAREEGG